MQTPFVFSNVDVLHSVKVFNNEMLLRRALAEYRQPWIIAPLGNFGFSRYVTDRAGFVPVFFDEISALYVSREALPEVARKHGIRHLDLTRNLIGQVAEMDQEQARSVIGEIERMLEDDPDGGLLHLLAARAYLRSGDPASASRHAATAARALPGSHQSHAVLADVLVARERWKDAAGAYRQAITRAPEEEERPYYRQLARCLAQLKEYKLGYRAMLRAVDVLSSDTSRTDLFELGLSAKSAGKPDEARDYLNLALLQTPPGDVEWTRRIEQALATVTAEP
jgi:tetratricopeptide (TPR) repeat protein